MLFYQLYLSLLTVDKITVYSQNNKKIKKEPFKGSKKLNDRLYYNNILSTSSNNPKNAKLNKENFNRYDFIL